MKNPKVMFLSLPMSGRSDAEIMHQIEKMETVVQNKFGKLEEWRSVNNYGCVIPEIMRREVQTPALLYLGKAIQIMSAVDGVMFGEGWEDARGCCIENKVAFLYDIPMYNSVGEKFYRR